MRITLVFQLQSVCCEKQPHQDKNHCCYAGGVCVTDPDENANNHYCDYPFALRIKYKWLYKDYEDPGSMIWIEEGSGKSTWCESSRFNDWCGITFPAI